MKISIEDVAKLAGVGKGTVSRVLNDHPDVSEKTAARVRHAIAALGYRPNVQARRLARQVSDLICFVLSNRDFLHQFHSLVLKGVEHYCSEIGRDVVFALWRYNLTPPPEQVVVPRIIADPGSVDGVVIAGANHVNCVKAVAATGLPYVAFGNNLIGCSSPTEVDSVWYDEAGGTREAIEYLVSMGHRRITFLGDISRPWFERNYRAYSDSMIACGLAPMLVSISNAPSYYDVGQRGAEQILASKEPVTAIFAGNDEIAIAALQTLLHCGVEVPRQMSVVGFDNSPNGIQLVPQLTTVHVPTEELGAECARFLFEKIANPAEVTGARIIPTRLVVRDSCARVRSEK